MDHAEALERIEIAAAEPDGLERLVAGDTADAAAVAGHLAGCRACAAELERMRAVAGIARSVIAEMPDPALRERTLAAVRELGVVRDGRAGTQAGPRLVPEPEAPDDLPGESAAARAPRPEVPAAAPPAAVAPAAVAPAARTASPRRGAPVAWLAGIAAALLAVGVVGYGLGGGFAGGPAHDDTPVAVVADAVTMAVDLSATPDAQAVRLAATPAGGGATGRLAYSGSSGDLVMVAAGLGDPGAGAEYGCWVEADGERRRIGTMYAAGDGLWAWSGAADGLDALPADAVFGVSLVPADGGAGVPVLTGGL